MPGGCVGKKGNETVPTVTGTKTTVSSDGGKATGTASASAVSKLSPPTLVLGLVSGASIALTLVLVLSYA